jgi:hypothetical protein
MQSTKFEFVINLQTARGDADGQVSFPGDRSLRFDPA